MTATHPPLRIHLPRAAAKTWEEYLAAHDGDAEKAGKAARADVAAREAQNSAARRFVDAYGSTIEALGLPAKPDDVGDAQAQASAALTKLQASESTSSEAAKQAAAYADALTQLGIDPAKLKDGIDAAKAKFAQADKAGTLEREVAFGKAAQALGFDAAKFARALRDEQGLPELRKVKVKTVGPDGAEVEQEQDVWGIPARDASGTETGFTALTEHADVKGWETSLKAASAPAAAPAPAPATPVLISQPATNGPAGNAISLAGGLPAGAGTV